jgi:hypothetical protein
MKKTILIRDIPLGFLFIVLSLYFTYGAMYLIGSPPVGIAILIFVCSYISIVLLKVAVLLLVGKEYIIDTRNEE